MFHYQQTGCRGFNGIEMIHLGKPPKAIKGTIGNVMGTPGIPKLHTPVAFGHVAVETGTYLPTGARKPVFDTFQLVSSQPSVKQTRSNKLWKGVSHPLLAQGLSANAKASGESVLERVEMYNRVYTALNREGKEHFKSLYKQGVLTDITADNNHSTLYHLYAILATPRARGFKAENILNETVRLLNKPYLISQKFPKLSENMAKLILTVRNNPSLNRAGEPAPPKPLTRSDLNVDFSSDCVPASTMFYMADKNPSELARHISELTSPLEAFYEKAKLTEISPENPKEALEILDYYDIPYVQIGPDELQIKVELPIAGKLRGINDSQRRNYNNGRSGIETVYQSALAYLPTRSYDPATGQRDAMEATVATLYQIESLTDQEKNELAGILQNSKSPLKTRQAFMNRLTTLNPKLSYAERTQIQEALQAESRGLTEIEKTLLETIIKDNGGVSSVTYQVVAGKADPRPGEEMNSYLYGYTRTFEQTTADMIEALKQGEFVIIGITDTDSRGAIIGGHEITLTGAFLDEKDGEIKFMVVDSDDDTPTPVIRSARELIPRIHHAGLPNKLAKKIHDEINSVESYLVPSKEDFDQFSPLTHTDEPLPSEYMEPPPEEPVAKEPTPPKPQPKPVSDSRPTQNQPVSQPFAPAQPQPMVWNTPVWPPIPQQSPFHPAPFHPAPFQPGPYPMMQYPQGPSPTVWNPQPWQPVQPASFSFAPPVMNVAYPAPRPTAPYGATPQGWGIQPWQQQPGAPYQPAYRQAS